MPYLCHCTDIEDSAAVRREHVEAHLRYVESILDRIAVAGPLRDEPGGEPVGSVLIYKTEDKDEALGLLHADPYYRAGLWSRVECRHINAVAGEWVGGRNW